MIIASDIESQGWSKEYIIGCVSWKTQKGNIKTQTFENKKDHLNWIINKGKQMKKEKHNLYVYFHNASFDIPRLVGLKNENLKIVKKTKPHIICLGDNIGKENEHIHTYIIDSMAILQRSLEDLAPRVGTKKFKPNPELEKKWFNDDHTEYTETELLEIKERCKTDSETLLKLLYQVKQEMKESNIRIRRLFSAGQIAHKAFNQYVQDSKYADTLFNYNNIDKRKGIGYHTTENSWRIGEASRAARFQAFKLGTTQNATMIDVNSLYPYACTQIPFPKLQTEQMIKEPLEYMPEKIMLKQMGITRCKIKIPKTEYGIAPIRAKQREYGVVYPEQECELIGSWTNMELQEMVKRGTEIIDAEYTINYAQCEENLLGNFMKTAYEKRLENEYNSWFWKMIMNNLTGRFSYKKESEDVIIDNIDNTTRRIAQGYNRTMRDGYDCMFVKRDEKTPSRHYAPIINTYIYAKSRMIMQEHLEKLPKEDALYIANDAIMFKGNHLNKYEIGNKLGQFKIQATGKALIYGIDNYMINDQIKMNGIGKIYRTTEDFIKGKINYKQMYTFSTAPSIEQIGDFVPRERNLIQTMEKTKEKMQNIQKQTEFTDKYTDDTWFYMRV